MNQPFFKKGLERPVYSDTVEFLSCLFFDIAVRESAVMVEEQFQYLLTPHGDAQLIVLKNIVYLFAHCKKY
jgi:hypothetical protein